MKISILGAGAMGCMMSGFLVKRHEVCLVDVWREHVDEINRNGLRIRFGGEVETVHPKAVTNPDDAKGADLVIVFVKSIQTAEAMEGAKVLLGGDTLVLSLQNGYGNDQDIRKFVPEKNIIMGTTDRAASVLGPGFVNNSGGRLIHIGPLGEDSSGAERTAAAFRECGLDTDVYDSHEVSAMIWDKLMINCANNALAAILDINTPQLADEPLSDLFKTLLRESVEVARACGLPFEYGVYEEKNYALLNSLAKEARTSMWQDVNKKRRTEIDRMNGAIVRLGREKGVPTPCSEMVVRLVHAIEKGYAA
ncbi:MAG: 2-dehydropantoate 2-reductase [Synergistaceae bacterium]|jgi:2-dehydropantoate 2-reductase|nr:2-dehydropantoate 2-reductase [Synergistaceae bacterium]